MEMIQEASNLFVQQFRNQRTDFAVTEIIILLPK